MESKKMESKSLISNNYYSPQARSILLSGSSKVGTRIIPSKTQNDKKLLNVSPKQEYLPSDNHAHFACCIVVVVGLSGTYYPTHEPDHCRGINTLQGPRI